METQVGPSQAPIGEENTDKFTSEKQQEPIIEEKNRSVSPSLEYSPSNTVLKQSSVLSPSRAMKIEDPERISREFIPNMLAGSHLDDVLENHIGTFISGKKQLIILTAAGKPVYSYGREEEDLAHVTGIIQALDSNFISMGERLKYIETEKGFFVLETIGSLIFFCYTPKEGTTIHLIRELFKLLYQHIILLLSKNALNRLEKQPNYDIQELLGNSSCHLTSMINQSEISLSLLFQCYCPLMISTSLRNQIRDLLLRTKRPDMVYGGMGINSSLVLCLQNKQFPLSPINQILLYTLITKSVSFRSSEGWLPICITDVKEDAYLHLYVGFVTEEMFVFFVTTANSPDVFAAYSEIKNQVYNVLLQSDKIIELYTAYNTSMSVHESGVPDLIHFMFKNDSSQIMMPKLDERIYDYHDYYKLIRKYQLIYSHMIQNNLNDYYENTNEHCIFASKSYSSYYIVVCSPFLTVDEMVNRKNKLGEWLTKRKDLLIQKEQSFF